MNASAGKAYARAVVEPLDCAVSPEAAAVSFACATGPAILESSLQHKCYGRFSIFACEPIDTFVANWDSPACPLRSLAERVAAYPAIAEPGGQVPFVGGWIGFLGYEAGLGIEGLHGISLRDVDLPLARLCLYDAAAIFDHQDRQWQAVAVDWPAPLSTHRPPVGRRLAAVRDRLESSVAVISKAGLTTPDRIPRASTPPQTNMSRKAYLAKVDRAKRYIEAGDIYQVNLTQRFSSHTDARPIDLYRRLRQASPSTYAALLAWDDCAVLSASPELFLDLRAGHVLTRPIKGTRPRGVSEHADAAYRQALAESEKDAAELIMIIDLLRNDLGRVCAFGSVEVTNPVEIETHPTVFHRVATIEGDLDDGASWLDLLLATFPGGSITGAPKIRAMQIINELEPTCRTAYCGSIGYLGLDGSMSLNIAIRTMVQIGDRVHAYAGGAIVADSDPADEYEESLVKARAMLRAMGCDTHAKPPTPHPSITAPM